MGNKSPLSPYEKGIWSRMLERGRLPPNVEAVILELHLPHEDRERMNFLFKKLWQGVLSEAEIDELRSYERICELLSFVRGLAKRAENLRLPSAVNQ
jgi:hypothetical protein